MTAGDTGQEARWRIERESAAAFRRARRKASLARIGRRLRRWISGVWACCENCCDFLVCFDMARGSYRASRRSKREFETVELERIVGSVGRGREFDGDFSPLCSCSKERWKRVDEAFREGKFLPPVELYKLGDDYFVLDGNHRVSVARYHGAAAVDALVRNLASDCGC